MRMHGIEVSLQLHANILENYNRFYIGDRFARYGLRLLLVAPNVAVVIVVVTHHLAIDL